MSHIADQVATQLFRAAQSERADFASGFDGSPLVQIALLHPASSRL